MDNITAIIIAIVSHLAWPATVIVLAWMFKDRVGSMLDRIDTANSKYLKVRLRNTGLHENLSWAEGVANGIGLPDAPPPAKAPNDPFEANTKSIVSAAQKRPAASFANAWSFFQTEAGSFIEARTGKRPPDDDLVPELAKYISRPMSSIVASLDGIANTEKANLSVTTDKDFAHRFAKLVIRIVAELRAMPISGSAARG